MNLNLSNLQVVVVGGTNGIGLSVSQGFLSEGAIVHIISRNGNNTLIDEMINAYSSKVFFYTSDASDEASLEDVCRRILINSGCIINVVISNVGNGAGVTEALADNKEWQRSWDINFTSALNTARIFSPYLMKSKGVLIFVSSIAGQEFLGAPTSYSTAKSAIISLSKSLSHKLAPDVRVNVVSPGNIWVENGTWDIKQKENPEKISKMLIEKVPLKRFGQTSEVSDLILFISSPRAAFITGSCLVIDGGQTTSY